MSTRVLHRFAVLSIAIGMSAAGGSARAGEYTRAVDLAARELTVREQAANVSIGWDGAVFAASPGHPNLPSLVLRVAVPAEESVLGADIFPESTRRLGPGLSIEPAPTEGPDRVPMPAPRDPAAYASSDLVPSAEVSVFPTGFFRGYRVVALRVAPVRYRAATGEIELVDRFAIRIRTGLSDGSAGVVREMRRDVTRDARGEVAATVDWVLGEDAARFETVLTPPEDARAFRPTDLPSLGGSPVDFVIVTSEALSGIFQELADYKTMTGVRTVVRTKEWIAAHYEAEDLAARIRDFLRDAHSHWGIRYALIGGDADVVPIRFGVVSRQNIPTDYYYACLDGNWNADGDDLFGEAQSPTGGPGDLVDFEPDIFVGRFPAGDASEAQVMIDKSMWYEGSDEAHFDGTYQETISFYAEALFPDDWEGDCDGFQSGIGDGAWIADGAFQTVLTAPFRTGAHMLYETVACWDTNYVPLPENRAAVLADFNSGRHFVVHIGHGSRDNMAVGPSGDKVVISDADNMTNGKKSSIFYAINCNSGAVDFDCIAEHFLANNEVNGSGGAVSVIAATELDYPAVSKPHLSHFLGEVLGNPSLRIGEVHEDGLRDLFAAGAAVGDNNVRWTIYSLILLGDPTLRTWTARPSRLFFSDNPGAHVMDGGTFSVQVSRTGTFSGLPGVTVTLYKENDTYLTAVTGVDGYVHFDFEPSSLGSFTVAATMPNFVPVVETDTVFPPTGASHLVVTAAGVDDSASGNDSGEADQGEPVDVSFTLANRGAQTASGISLSASTSSSFASITQASATAPDISGGGQGFSTPISLTVAADLPDTLVYVDIPIELSITSSAGTVSRTVNVSAGIPHVEHAGITRLSGAGGPQDITVSAFNRGNGTPLDGEVQLVAVDPGAVDVTQGTAPILLTPGETTTSGVLTYSILGPGTIAFDLTYRDDTGTLSTRRLELTPPSAPSGLTALGAPDNVAVRWARVDDADLLGYNVYRRNGGVFERANDAPVPSAYFVDLGLSPLTQYQYAVTAVDSSGNEGAPSDTVRASTSPAFTHGFPLSLGGSSNRGSVTIAELDQLGGPRELVFGSQFVYALHGDGSEVLDGDSTPATVGIFGDEGASASSRFWAKPAVADLDGDGVLDVVAINAFSGQLFCWDANGVLKWGGSTHQIGSPDVNLWSSPAVGNIDDDAQLEIVFWHGQAAAGTPYRGTLLAFNHDGTEVVNGDGTAATKGVFWKSSRPESNYNYGSVALADLDGDNRLEIVAAERASGDGYVHAFDYSGGTVSELPGWPFVSTGNSYFSSSPAIVDIENNGSYEIFVVGQRSLFGLTEGGSAIPGFPKPYTRSDHTLFNDFLPSPVIGDFNGDGDLDVVHGWADGQIYAYTAKNGVPLPGWNPLTLPTEGEGADLAFFNGALANVDVDPRPELVIGTGRGDLFAINVDGSLVGGFPYFFGGRLFGAPAVWDIDRSGTADIVVIGETQQIVALDMAGTTFIQAENPWPQFRHDPRNSGVYGSGLGTTPIDLGSLAAVSTAPGRVELGWSAEGDYARFVIERAHELETRRAIGEAPGSSPAERFTYVDGRAPEGKVAQYWVVGHKLDGEIETVGPIVVRVATAPMVSALLQNTPNPFNPLTTIRYRVGDASGSGGQRVELVIYDLDGRRIRTLVRTTQEPGQHEIVWDGKDRAGNALASGVYVYALKVGDETFSRKLVLSR